MNRHVAKTHHQFKLICQVMTDFFLSGQELEAFRAGGRDTQLIPFDHIVGHIDAQLTNSDQVQYRCILGIIIHKGLDNFRVDFLSVE